MPWVKSLRWTSRTAVCDRLVQYLLDISPSPGLPDDAHGSQLRPERSQVARLLIDLAGPAHAPALRQLLFDRREEAPIRVAAFRWLSDQRALFTAPELQQILWDPVLREEEICYWFDQQFLPLFDSALEHRVVLEYVWGRSPKERAEMLQLFSLVDAGGDQRERIAPSLWPLLYDLWLSQDREELEKAGDEGHRLNLRTAFHTRYRLASQALLREYWRQAKPGDRRTLIRWLQPDWDLADKNWDLPGDEPLLRELLEECAANDLATLSEVLEELELPLEFLLERLGPESLLSRIFEKVEAANQLLREDRWEDQTEAMQRAYHLLLDWPDASVNTRIERMLRRLDTSPRPRRMLFWVLWDRDPDLAHAVAWQVAEEHGDRDLIRQSVRRIGSRSSSAHREFLLQQVAVEETDAETLCLALEALEQIGADEPRWLERLALLADHPHHCVCLRAAAALLRRGDESRRAVIEAAAMQTERPGRRATALKLLGELDPARYFDLFREVLLEGAARRCGSCHGLEPAGAAARALAGLGTPEATTVLLQVCLVAEPGRTLAGDLRALLARLAHQQDGQADLPWRPWSEVRDEPMNSGMVALEQMSEADRRIIGECLKAATEGPFFPDWEFHILFGLYRWEVAEIAAAWPNVSHVDTRVMQAVNNSMCHLLGYPHGCEEEWPDYISASEKEVDRVFSEWRRLQGWDDDGTASGPTRTG